MTGLSTHVLDLTYGKPAHNVSIELYFQDGTSSDWQLLKTADTNLDGRLDQPLLSTEDMKIGSYEIVFHIGSYYREMLMELPEPSFLETVPVRFSVATLPAHYHVPLLISPWGYQVYRGS